MAKLVVTLHGQTLSTLELSPGGEYWIGRNPDSAVVLEGQKGISRQHLKLYQQNEVWIVELLARFGSLVMDGQPAQTLQLDRACVFSAPPYEFRFDPDSATASSDAGKPVRGAEDVELEVDQTSRLPALHNSHVGTNTLANSEATSAGLTNLIPFLRVKNSNSGKEEVLQLEGHVWVAGRDPNCEIHIDDSKASRRHFELAQTPAGFFITDLGSSNGTLLNEEPVTPNEPWQLVSGDEIKVSKVTISFEIRDPQFHQRALVANAMPQPLPMTPGQMPMPMPSPLPMGLPTGPAVVQVQEPLPHNWREYLRPENLRRFDFKKHKVRVAVGLMIPVLIYGLLQDDTASTTAPGNSTTSASVSLTFEQLSPEKQRAIKDSFGLARNHYMKGQYSLCLGELKRLHEMVPLFENSKELEDHCAQGNNLLAQMQEKERKDREKEEAERFIKNIVEDCRNKLTPSTTVDEINLCLAPAVERDPENPTILELVNAVRATEEAKRSRQMAQLEQQRQRAACQRVFEEARRLQQRGQLAKSIREYQRFLDCGAGDLPQQRSQAEREVASARAALNEKVSKLLEECRGSLESSQYKQAYLQCSDALNEDPSQISAKSLRDQAHAEMLRELKSIYEDSVLEESMGNIDSAKQKWKLIMEKAIPSIDYYLKAKRNLQKYGG